MLTTRPLTVTEWDDFVELAEQMGSNRHCWCLWWRHDGNPNREGTGRQRARALVEQSPHPVGLIAYDGERPVGWAAVSPREEYPRLNRGRDTAPVDRRSGVYVAPCFFVVEEYRGRGVARWLVERAVELARECGATAVEGVPGDPKTRARSASGSYTGTVSMFEGAGFREVARRTPKGRVVMRRDMDPATD